jgi:hypothetical protein
MRIASGVTRTDQLRLPSYRPTQNRLAERGSTSSRSPYRARYSDAGSP